MKNILNSKKAGFTFVELLFAIVVMGTMFGLAMTVFINMLRFYVFAGSVRQNQENSRNLLDSISRDVKFGQLLQPSVKSLGVANAICVYSPETSTTILYNFDKATGKITKYVSKNTFATFKEADGDANPSTNIPPVEKKACSPASSNSIVTELKLNDSLGSRVMAFNVVSEAGARTVANTQVASITINFDNITKASVNPPLTNDGKCADRDIYCNKLILNTAINIRGGD